MIKIEHLRKEYPNAVPLKDVNVEINEGDVIAVIGPSGTGKSTLLRCINMLEKPTSGHIWVNDVEITDPKCDLCKVRQKLGMVFQSFNLFGHLTVIENIMLAPVELLKKSKKEAYEDAMRLLRMVGLAEKGLNFPDVLSGGQKQRVAIARTLAMDPEIILLDEPTSALDPTMVGEVRAVIRELAGSGKTMMIVTHEMNFARSISNRVFYMDGGGIYEDGTPEQIFDAPQRENTRRFIRKLIPAKLAYRIHLVYEELVHRTLLPLLDRPHIRVVIEYSEAGEAAVFSVYYNGELFDAAEKADELSLSIIRSAAVKTEYKTDAGEYPNHLTLRITG